MGRMDKLIIKILTGQSDQNIQFIELCNLLLRVGFSQRIKGSHHIFYKEDVKEIINIQDNNGKAKPYQVKQIREILISYKFDIIKDDEI
ncbi:MAG: type II toxin-antitoxin system HicA family toxin [Saprospiraceae bacterium]|nr:type II toxin-antitoxin system HicA family toxin [Saprospiraceae bacterium]